jgi:hypothetical protein
MLADLLDLPSSGHITSTVTVSTSFPNFVYQKKFGPEPYKIQNDATSDSLIRILQHKEKLKASEASKGKLAAAIPASAKRKAVETPLADEKGKKKKSESTTDPGPSSSPAPLKLDFTKEELLKKPVVELQLLLKARQLPPSGKKEDLATRLIEYQRRQKRLK